MPAWVLTSVVLAVLASIAYAQPVRNDSASAAIRAFGESRLPRTGAWEALFAIGSMDGGSTLRCAYSWDTGAAFRASFHGGFGRTAAGEFFHIRQPSMRSPILVGPEAFPLDISKLDDYMPAVLLLSLVREEHDFEYVTPTDGGGLRVGVLWPASARVLPPHMAGAAPELVRLEFDDRGRLVRREQGQGRFHLVWTYEYDARSPEGFPIPSRVARTEMRDGTITEQFLIEARTHSHSDPVSFDPEYVRARMVEADERVAVGLAQERVRIAAGLAARPRERGADALPRPSNAPLPVMPPSLSPYERFRWPLILSGVIVATIGALAWWKRARG